MESNNASTQQRAELRHSTPTQGSQIVAVAAPPSLIRAGERVMLQKQQAQLQQKNGK